MITTRLIVEDKLDTISAGNIYFNQETQEACIASIDERENFQFISLKSGFIIRVDGRDIQQVRRIVLNRCVEDSDLDVDQNNLTVKEKIILTSAIQLASSKAYKEGNYQREKELETLYGKLIYNGVL